LVDDRKHALATSTMRDKFFCLVFGRSAEERRFTANQTIAGLGYSNGVIGEARESMAPERQHYCDKNR
jgi:hypothetical protein